MHAIIYSKHECAGYPVYWDEIIFSLNALLGFIYRIVLWFVQEALTIYWYILKDIFLDFLLFCWQMENIDGMLWRRAWLLDHRKLHQYKGFFYNNNV